MVEVERDLWRSPGATFLLRQDCLKRANQDCIQMSFQFLQVRKVHNQLINLLCCKGTWLAHGQLGVQQNHYQKGYIS